MIPCVFTAIMNGEKLELNETTVLHVASFAADGLVSTVEHAIQVLTDFFQEPGADLMSLFLDAVETAHELYADAGVVADGTEDDEADTQEEDLSEEESQHPVRRKPSPEPSSAPSTKVSAAGTCSTPNSAYTASPLSKKTGVTDLFTGTSDPHADAWKKGFDEAMARMREHMDDVNE